MRRFAARLTERYGERGWQLGVDQKQQAYSAAMMG